MEKISKIQVSRAAACALFTIVLVACGGGGGGGAYFPLGAASSAASTDSASTTADATSESSVTDTSTSVEQSQPTPSDSIVASASVEARCVTPRTGIDPTTGDPYLDKRGSLASEKSWVRAWIDETYLWYDEVPVVSAKDYATPVAYFDVLKTSALSASGKPKDRFHFSVSTEEANANSQGAEIGYGMTLAFINGAPPRDLRVAYVEDDSPAAGKVTRGDRLLKVDGIDVVNASSNADIDQINAALTPPSAGESHIFMLQASDGTVRSQITMAIAAINRNPVPLAGYFNLASGQRAGYILFNEHSERAEYDLVGAMLYLQALRLSDLVIDMRYNGGGIVAIASELAYMVAASPTRDLSAKPFEEFNANKKNPFKWLLGDAKVPVLDVPFYSQTLGISAQQGYALPQLGLSHVTVLAGPDTCSASEAVINGLRGVGVTVDIVGGTTCGKPYAFNPKDNCGTTYFAIQMQGVNAQKFGDYGGGFAPTCAVIDDFNFQLGDSREARLREALAMMNGYSCPTPALAKGGDVIRAKAEAERAPYLRRSPLREIQWLGRPQR
jgi:C-terminal processing protease CtpA/Prc